MHFRIHGPLDSTDLKRALDQILLLTIEQDITIVDDVHIHLDAWSGNKRVKLLDDGTNVSVSVVSIGESQQWMTCGNGKFDRELPQAPKYIEPEDTDES
ncbi:hypothetical protein WJS89_09385 [Sphingomicrobium sp. XHP0235]|uniref:hypothetical protein n=1 Tax=Sphingomicrobium aquimarinum TaxID=3133971 RepID=UPI0031FEEBC9